MKKRYIVLYADKIINARSLNEAIVIGKKIAAQGYGVDIDEVTDYPGAEPGMVDFSQRMIKSFPAKKVPASKQGDVFGGWRLF